MMSNDAISRVNRTEQNKTKQLTFTSKSNITLTMTLCIRLQHLMHRIAILTKNNNCVKGNDAHAFHFIDQRF